MGNQLETQSKTSVVTVNDDSTTVNGFIVKPSQVKLATWIFVSYPKTAENVQLQNQELRTTCMNLLFSIIQTLYHKRDLTESELSKAAKDLSDLTQAGFNLDWLKSKHEKVSLERKKHHASRIVELEQKVKKLELMMSDLKVELEKEKAKFN